MASPDVPKATAKRLPLYYRYLKFFENTGRHSISSHELSDVIQVDSATIRRDFSYLGATGKRGAGYQITLLLDVLSRMLRQDQLVRIALVGVGNIGQALLNYNFQSTRKIRISAAFDVDQQIVGTIQNGVPIYSMAELSKQMSEQQLDIAILAVPAENAQEATDTMVKAHVRGIMNFSPRRLSVPSYVRALNIDLGLELQGLIYFLDHYDEQSIESKSINHLTSD